jgi:hypothetical protein
LPASAAVERLFSCAGLTMNKKRTRLTDNIFESLVFLKKQTKKNKQLAVTDEITVQYCHRLKAVADWPHRLLINSFWYDCNSAL